MSVLPLDPFWQGRPFDEPDQVCLKLAFAYSPNGPIIVQYLPSTVRPPPSAAPKSVEKQQVQQPQSVLRSAEVSLKRAQDLRPSEAILGTQRGSPSTSAHLLPSKSSAVNTLQFDCELFLGAQQNEDSTRKLVLYMCQEEEGHVIAAGSLNDTVTTLAGVTPQTRWAQLQRAAGSEHTVKVINQSDQISTNDECVIHSANDLEAFRLSMMLEKMKQVLKTRSGGWTNEQVDSLFATRTQVIVVSAAVRIEDKQNERKILTKSVTNIGIPAQKVKFIANAEAIATSLGTTFLEAELQAAGTPENQDKWFKNNKDVAYTSITTEKSCTGVATVKFHKTGNGKYAFNTNFFSGTSEIPHIMNTLSTLIKRYLTKDIQA
jgi:hypothetical protein